MKISFAQLVGFLDFTTNGLLTSAMDSSSNSRNRSKNSNQCTGRTGSMGLWPWKAWIRYRGLFSLIAYCSYIAGRSHKTVSCVKHT